MVSSDKSLVQGCTAVEAALSHRGLRRALYAVTWVACFGIGCYVASVAEGGRVVGGVLPVPGSPEEAGQEWSKEDPQAKNKWAYVMMAYDEPGKPMQNFLWGAIATARSLQQFTEHRVVLLTNHETFPDGSPVKEQFQKLGVEVREAKPLELPGHSYMDRRFQLAFMKLQAWSLTDFEKVIWVDVDGLVYRNMDWLFEREWMWAARDDWNCILGQDMVNTGLVSLYPGQFEYHGLVEHARQNPKMSSHQVVATYFADVRKKPVQFLSELEARFGRCLGAAVPSPYLSPDGTKTNGLWSVPAFVHKSGGFGQNDDGVHDNVCFTPDADSQRYFVGSSEMNVCHFHPLGHHWRAMFCEGALDRMGLKLPTLKSYCDDQCYYWGGKEAGEQCGGPVDGTPVFGEYWARVRGVAAIDKQQPE